jgi:hypothetical protein
MNKLLMLVLYIFTLFTVQTSAGTCAGGRLACFTSCLAQNCATGYCNGADPMTSICVCSRCRDGPIYPK